MHMGVSAIPVLCVYDCTVAQWLLEAMDLYLNYFCRILQIGIGTEIMLAHHFHGGANETRVCSWNSCAGMHSPSSVY